MCIGRHTFVCIHNYTFFDVWQKIFESLAIIEKYDEI